MPVRFTTIPGSVTAPKGFLASGVFCDIKRMGTGKGSNKGNKRDLALIVSEVPAAVAGMFTTNQVCAAPVRLCAARAGKGVAKAIVVNSGNANACTGARGVKDAEAMAALAARCLKISADHVLVGSTGRIGMPMPMAQVKRGILQVAPLLGRGPEYGAQAAEAIMTSDTHSKQIAIEFPLGGKTVRIGGICKGAGMIQPGMSANRARPAAIPLHATMLCFLTTDAAVEPPALQALLQEAVANSFNRVTVDGDMSTNDTVLVLANGIAQNAAVRTTGGGKQMSSADGSLAFSRAQPPSSQIFQAALSHVCLELAKMIVRDGEGVTRFITVRVAGAKSFADADAAARAVANSLLVKTSWCGGDPNWGRILDALGYSSAELCEEKIDVGYSLPGSRKILYSLKKGRPTRIPFRSLCQIVAEKEFDLHIHLNLGHASALLYTSDLTESYVEFNKGDVTDPSSLGG